MYFHINLLEYTWFLGRFDWFFGPPSPHKDMGKLSVPSNSKEVLELGNPYRKIWLLELMMVYYAKVVDK